MAKPSHELSVHRLGPLPGQTKIVRLDTDIVGVSFDTDPPIRMTSKHSNDFVEHGDRFWMQPRTPELEVHTPHLHRLPIRERALLFGGSFDVEPYDTGRGGMLRIVLPLEPLVAAR